MNSLLSLQKKKLLSVMTDDTLTQEYAQRKCNTNYMQNRFNNNRNVCCPKGK